MNEESKFKKLKLEITKNVSQFSESVQFGICFFDAGLAKFPSNGRPADANPALKAAALAFVQATIPGHGTCSKPALTACLTFANQSSAKRKVIIYLSDGFNTCPGADPEVYAQQVLSEITAKNTQHVKINTVCIGADVDEEFMKKLAALNHGQASRVR